MAPKTKRCAKCRRRKAVSSFYANARGKNGLQDRCKKCCKDFQESYRNDPSTRASRLATARKHHLKASYGITEAEYDRLFKLQNGRCAICMKLPGKVRLAVDHDHTTDEVRGLLCGTCNRMLGMAMDSQHLLEMAKLYLQRFQRSVDKFRKFR